jgi:hypothetical protein
MQDLLFCPKCGAPIQPEDQFCTSCGASLLPFKQATVESAPVVTTTPVESKPVVQPVAAPLAASVTKTTAVTPAPVLHKVLPFIAVLVFVGLGFWSWYEKKESRKKNSFDTESTSSETTRETPSTEDYTNDYNKPTTTNPVSNTTLYDFAGIWRAYEANNNEENDIKIGNPEDDLFIDVKNGSLDIYPRNEIDKERTAFITCNEVIGNTITCRGKEKNEKTGFTIKLELQSSKNEMTITIIPDEPTESLILKARRI